MRYPSMEDAAFHYRVWRTQMPKKYSFRSDQEWMDLITECRQSGLSDYAWCEQNNVPCSSFYNAISRLRRKACSIPEHSGTVPVMDLTSLKQDVVQIDIVPDPVVTDEPAGTPPALPNLDNLHTIEIIFPNRASVRIGNSADVSLLCKVISAVGRGSC